MINPHESMVPVHELKAKELSIREPSKLIGKMVAAMPGVNYAALYIKTF